MPPSSNQQNPLQPSPEPMQNNSGAQGPRYKSWFQDILPTIAIIVGAPLLAFIMIQFVFQNYEVDGPSMERTLYNQDRLIVLKLPKTFARISGEHYIPHRYEIIVFNHHGGFSGSANPNAEKQLIKRVIGLPGDRVVVKDGVVTIYNQENPQGYLVDRAGPESAVIGNTSGNVDQVIKEGEVFVMGDNRENSLDSRELGTVHSEDIIGKLTARIYPFDKVQKF
jgi:signal peptidase I